MPDSLHHDGLPGVLTTSEEKANQEKNVQDIQVALAPDAAVDLSKEAPDGQVETQKAAIEKGATVEQEKTAEELAKEADEVAEAKRQHDVVAAEQLKKDIEEINAIRLSLGVKTRLTTLARAALLNPGIFKIESSMPTEASSAVTPANADPANNTVNHLQGRYAA